MRALPLTFREVKGAVGNVVAVTASGDAGGNWYVERAEDSWHQIADCQRQPVATVSMDQDTAWKLVTKRRSREAVRQQFPLIRITGDEAIGLPVLDMLSVMA